MNGNLVENAKAQARILRLKGIKDQTVIAGFKYQVEAALPIRYQPAHPGNREYGEVVQSRCEIEESFSPKQQASMHMAYTGRRM